MSSDKHEEFREVLLEVRERIETCRLNHRYFEDAKAELELALESKSNIVFLVGTTGVGKGVLVDTLAEELNASVENDPYQVRAVCSVAASPHGHEFSWLALYVDMLDVTGEPLLLEKVDRQDRLERLRRGEKPAARNDSLNGFRSATISAIQDRGVKVVFIDEAKNLVMNERGYTLSSRLRVLRDLSNAVSGDRIAGQKRGCKVVLISTPEILEEAIRLSAEIVRRMKKVVFSRYTLKGGTKGKDCQEFRRIVQRFVGFFPEEYRPRLSTENVLSLQVESVGCIGNLVSWFVRAINRCLAEGAGNLEWRHFEMEVMSDDELEDLLDQCEEDERIIWKSTRRSGCGVKRLNALNAWKAKKGKEGKTASADAAANEATRQRGGKRRKTRVGEQKPVRHRMGRSSG